MAILISGSDYLIKEGIASIVDRLGERPVMELGGSAPRMFIGLFDDGRDSLLEQVPEMLERCPVLLVGDRFTSSDVERLMDLGVKCIVTKRCSEEEIEDAIKAALSGDEFYCSNVVSTLTQSPNSALAQLDTLSSREKEVLKLVLEGKTSNQIADSLFVSLHTVNSHRKNILRKFELRSPAELLIFALKEDLRAYLD